MDLGQVSADVVAATARRASILWAISTPCVRSRPIPLSGADERHGMDQWAAELLALCPKTSTSRVLQPEA